MLPNRACLVCIFVFLLTLLNISQQLLWLFVFDTSLLFPWYYFHLCYYSYNSILTSVVCYLKVFFLRVINDICLVSDRHILILSVSRHLNFAEFCTFALCNIYWPISQKLTFLKSISFHFLGDMVVTKSFHSKRALRLIGGGLEQFGAISFYWPDALPDAKPSISTYARNAAVLFMLLCYVVLHRTYILSLVHFYLSWVHWIFYWWQSLLLLLDVNTLSCLTLTYFWKSQSWAEFGISSYKWGK